MMGGWDPYAMEDSHGPLRDIENDTSYGSELEVGRVGVRFPARTIPCPTRFPARMHGSCSLQHHESCALEFCISVFPGETLELHLYVANCLDTSRTSLHDGLDARVYGQLDIPVDVVDFRPGSLSSWQVREHARKCEQERAAIDQTDPINMGQSSAAD